MTLEEAIRSIELGNNGSADIGVNTALVEAVKAAGYPVVRTRDLSGLPVYRGYTPRAYAIRCSEMYRYPPEMAETPRRIDWNQNDFSYDIEGAILARQELSGYLD